jgi:hypothetical protein
MPAEPRTAEVSGAVHLILNQLLSLRLRYSGPTVRKTIRGATGRRLAGIGEFPLERGRLAGKGIFSGQFKARAGRAVSKREKE